MVTIKKGILSGLNLHELTDADLHELSQSPVRTGLNRGSFYQGRLKGPTFQGVTFTECSFARVIFQQINFSRCKFVRVDLTRAGFQGLFFFRYYL